MSIGETVLGAALPLVGDAIKSVRREFARRLQAGETVALASLDDEMDEALDILAQDAATTLGSVGARIKSWATRDAIFKHPLTAQWIATERTREAIKGAVLARIREEPDQAFAQAAIDHYAAFAEFDDGRAASAEASYAAACAYVIKSLQRDVPVNDRIILQAISGVNDRIDDLASWPSANPARHDTTDVIDAHVAKELDRLRRRRFFTSARTADDADSLARSLIEGRFQSASADLRVRALAWCARWLSQTDLPRAQALLAEARAIAAGPVVELDLAAALLAVKTDGIAALTQIDIDASPLHHTAALQLLRHCMTHAETLDHAAEAGIGFEGLDADGRYVLIATHIEADRWDDAIAVVRQLSDADYATTPALSWIAATIIVAASVVDDIRPGVMTGVPLHPARFPLPEDRTSVAERRVAAALMVQVARACEALDLPRERDGAERFQLWLDLRDSEQHMSALDRLKARMRDSKRAMAAIPLAIDFGIGLSLEDAGRMIDRHLARHPKGDVESASARLSLILLQSQTEPGAAVDALQAHRDALATYLDAGALVGLEVQLLFDAGRHDEARDRLASTDADALPARMRRHIDTIVSQDEGPTLETLEALYADAPSLTLLGSLVSRHQALGMSDRYLELARQFILATKRAEDMRGIVGFLIEQGERDAAADLLAELPELTAEIPDLLSCAAGLAFDQGKLVDAEQALVTLEALRDERGDRSLRYHLLLATGRWPELDAFLEREWSRRDEREPRELAQLADLASRLGSARIRDFLDLAINRAPDDPHVLVAAYSAATSAGIEETVPDAGHWIMRAADLSGDDGPVQKSSLETLLAGQGDWNDRVEEAWRSLATAKLPLTAAAIMLRRAWLELHLVPLLANLRESDAKRRAIVPLFGGKRGPNTESVPSDIGPIALDRTAIMTLAALGLLEAVLTVCPEVYIAHGTLADLFEQRRRLTFHQPSKILFAHQLSALLAKGTVKPFTPTVTPDPGLLADIGATLAELIGEAAAQPDGQHLVVHPHPITRVGSLLHEPIDLSAFDAQLISCTAVIDFLEQSGRLTVKEIETARNYLGQHDRPWPCEPEIQDGATLYLSHLSVDYFRFTGILDKIAAAGLDVFISRSEISEARALLDHERISEEVGTVIETTRRTLAAAIAEGRVRLDTVEHDEDDREMLLSLARLAESAPIFVCDERFINQYDRFDTRIGQTRILTSLELVEVLAASGRLATHSMIDIRTRLRRMGALFVPLGSSEIIALIEQAPIRDGVLRETGELRALRENVRLIQSRGWFDPEADPCWLLAFQNALAGAVIEQWRDGIDDLVARARCDWLLALFDFRDWTDTIAEPQPANLAVEGTVLALGKLVTMAFALKGDAKDRFGVWLEETVMAPLWYREPRLEAMFLDHMRGTIRQLGQDQTIAAYGDIPFPQRLRLCLLAFPKFLQLALGADDAFSEAPELEIGGLVTLGATGAKGSIQFDRNDFFNAITAIYADPSGHVVLNDVEARRWTVIVKDMHGEWPLIFTRDDQRIQIKGISAIHPSMSVRLEGLNIAAAEAALPTDAHAAWSARLRDAPLDQTDIDGLNADLADTPRAMANALAASIEAREAPLDLLVPRGELYYRRLIRESDADSIDAYARDITGKSPATIRAGILDDARDMLLLASHPRIVAATGLSDLSADDLETLGRWVIEHGDLLSRIGFIEAALSQATAGSTIEAQLIELIGGIDALSDHADDGELRYLSALIMLVDGELSRKQTLATWPPFRRRIAAIAQASLIARVTFGEVDTAQFASSAIEDRGWRFLVQSLVDLRQEPRWRPDYVGPEQLKHEFVGRILNRAGTIGVEALSESIGKLIFGEEPGSLQPLTHFPMSYWPGPIEGAINDEVQLSPASYQSGIEEALSHDNLTIDQLFMLINTNGLFRIASDQIDRTVDRIRQSGPRLFPTPNEVDIQSALVGLSYVAAANRKPELADQVRVVARRRRQSGDTSISIGDEFHLALVASAAHEDAGAWREALGPWLHEIAFSISTKRAAQDCATWLGALCEIDPLLHTRVGRARAALAIVLEG